MMNNYQPLRKLADVRIYCGEWHFRINFLICREIPSVRRYWQQRRLLLPLSTNTLQMYLATVEGFLKQAHGVDRNFLNR